MPLESVSCHVAPPLKSLSFVPPGEKGNRFRLDLSKRSSASFGLLKTPRSVTMRLTSRAGICRRRLRPSIENTFSFAANSSPSLALRLYLVGKR